MTFIGQAIKNMYHTGSVWPSSRALGLAMSRSFRGAVTPRRILEVGPGSGPFTRVILEALEDGDEYHLAEINEEFCRELELRMLEPYRSNHPDRIVRLHQGPVEDLKVESRFGFIVCGLPFNNFPPKVARSIFRQLLELLDDDGELAYFEYAAVRNMRAPFVGSEGRRKIKRIDAHGKSLRRKFDSERELVLANIPPAYAIRLKSSESNGGSPT
ncbi:MAG: methyltransferase domain-containing protein [Planctomycetota bacterium]|nr:methyltransferase domain-containing protein [Planctomycetota bacterium]